MQKNLTDSAGSSKAHNAGRQLVSLDSPGVGSVVSRKILYDINAYAIHKYNDGHRWHLGASLIGDDCSRYLWYVFRWCGKEEGGYNHKDEEDRHNNLGRMVRLWRRGHREEDWYVELLTGIGAQVWTRDKDGNQFRMNAVNGHFGGSLDGVVRLPERYGIPEPALCEFKTNGTGKGHDLLFEKGVAVVKPQHFTQMTQYGFHYKLNYCIYFNVNKNDDTLYVEVVKLNFNQAPLFIAKAERIITTDEPPPRIAENPTYFRCQYCSMKGVCHERKAPLRNCRSCRFARPVLNGEWHCGIHNAIIPREYVPKACDSYGAIVNES